MNPIKLCDLDSVAPNDVKTIDLDGHLLLAARVGDDWYVLDDTCSHAQVSLGDGILEEDDLAIECPKHGALFSLETGEALTLPATRPVARHDVSLREDGVYVTLTTDHVEQESE